MCGLEEGLLQPPGYTSVAQSWTVASVGLRYESISCSRFLSSILKGIWAGHFPYVRSYLSD